METFVIIPKEKIESSQIDKLEEFPLYSSLVTDKWAVDKYGEGAYFINTEWLGKATNDIYQFYSDEDLEELFNSYNDI